MAETTDFIGAMSVQDWSRYTEDGTEESDPRWPFILEFEPYDVYSWTDAW